MGLKFQLTKDADRAICLIYKEFLNRRKSGLQKSRAKDFSMPQSREPIYSSMPQVDFNDALSELNSVGLIILHYRLGNVNTIFAVYAIFLCQSHFDIANMQKV